MLEQEEKNSSSHGKSRTAVTPYQIPDPVTPLDIIPKRPLTPLKGKRPTEDGCSGSE